jgi:hypothetical protein
MWTLASTREAGFGQRHLERTGQTSICVLEGYLQFMMVVCAPYWTTLSSERSTKHLGEDVVGVRGKSGWISLRGPEPVKVLTLLWIAEDVICALNILEFFGVTRWFIRVKSKS